MKLRDQSWNEDWKMLILWFEPDICSCKLSAKVSLMLDNPILVPALCKLNHISVFFIQITTKITSKQLFPLSESNFFLSHPQRFGSLGKFQHNIKISIKMASVRQTWFSDMLELYQFCKQIWRTHQQVNTINVTDWLWMKYNSLWMSMQRFEDESVDFNIIMLASDEDLIQLGIRTSNRVKLRDAWGEFTQEVLPQYH